MAEVGCWGMLLNVVVIWPVTGSRRTSPADLISTPSPSTARYSASSDPNGLFPCCATYTEPVSGLCNAGEPPSAEPPFADSGQTTGLALSNPISSGVHAPSPFAVAGLTTIPTGSVTTAFFRFPSANPNGASSCGNRTSTPNPDGEPPTVVSGFTASDGLKLNRPHPSKAGIAPASATKTPGSCQLSVLIPPGCGPVHDVGNGKNGFGSTPAECGDSASLPGPPSQTPVL